MSEQNFKLKGSNTYCRFGNHIYKSQGMIGVRIPFGGGGLINFQVDVVKADITLLLGQRDLKSHVLLLNYLADQTEHRRYKTHSLVKYKHGHSFLNGIILTFYSHEINYSNCTYMSDILRATNYFIYLSERDRANPTKSVRRMLKDILQACHQCRKLSVKPHSFEHPFHCISSFPIT